MDIGKHPSALQVGEYDWYVKYVESSSLIKSKTPVLQSGFISLILFFFYK